MLFTRGMFSHGELMPNEAIFIRANTLALSLNVSEVGLTGLILKGRVPKPDTIGRFPRPKTRAWSLDTLAHWRPDVARRCVALSCALEKFPLKAA